MSHVSELPSHLGGGGREGVGEGGGGREKEQARKKGMGE